jgi:hypothetical protein
MRRFVRRFLWTGIRDDLEPQIAEVWMPPDDASFSGQVGIPKRGLRCTSLAELWFSMAEKYHMIIELYKNTILW